MRLADRRKQDAQVIVNLCRRRDGGTRIRPSASLFDRDRRREAFDEIDVRFFHLVEELPGVSGQALHVAPLSLGVEGVEGERRLSRAAQARDNDQFFPWNFNVEILEIVLACSADLDTLRRHTDDKCRTCQSSTTVPFLHPKAPDHE